MRPRPLHAGRLWASGYALAAPEDRTLAGRTRAPGEALTTLGHPRTLTWTEVSHDGAERVRTGRVWSECPRVSGLSGFWVRGEWDHQMHAVVRAHRRVGTGRVRGAKWRPGRGRVMEVGEWFTETHPQSPTGALTAASRFRVSLPSVIRVDPLPAWVMASMSTPQ